MNATTLTKEPRFEDALEAAAGAFWAEVAKHYPEITTGDMSPQEVFFSYNAQKRMLSSWLESNMPEQELA